MTAADVVPPGAPARLTYREAHPIYRAAGWTGVLPLPEGAKWPPPEGWTGWHGGYPSHADSEAWCDVGDYGDTHQLCLRMAPDVIGLDVDHYGNKRGADTLAEAQRRWGPLPPSPRSSARGPDNPSGIRLYRVPDGTTLATVIGFPELGLGGVEIIQRHHRYAVAWPSTNPHANHAPYLWYDTEGPDRPPHVDRLLWLPDRWREELTSTGEPGQAEASPQTVAAFAVEHAAGDKTASLRGPLTIFERDVRAGLARHDAMVNAACMAAREARAGAYPAAEARRWLRDAFVAAMAEARPGQRLCTPVESRREFESIWGWAVGQALGMTVEECRARIKGWRSEGFFGLDAGLTLQPEKINHTPTDQQQLSIVTHSETSPLNATHGDGTTVSESASSEAPQAEQAEQAEEDTRSAEEVAAEHAAALEAELLAGELAKAKRRRRVEEILAAENRPPLEELTFDQFLDAPPPDYLVPKMFYRDGLAVVFGAPGAAKSFLVLDVALSLATGTPWRGRPLGRGKVHYVMAEGQATNTLRALAWLHHRNVARAEGAGWFIPYTEPVMLTDAGIVDYLPRVIRDRPDMIVLDTKNLMFAGKENQGEDYGAMLRVLHRLRRAAGGACVVLIDHSGLGDDGRTRGSNAQKGGVETEVRVWDDEGTRRVEVTRDKSGAVGASWAFRLQQVPEVPRPADVTAPAVCVPVDAERGGVLPFAGDGSWFADTRPLPDEIVEMEMPQRKGKAAMLNVFRLLRYVRDDEAGLTRAQIKAMLTESGVKHSDSDVYAAVAAMCKAGITEPGDTPAKIILAARFA